MTILPTKKPCSKPLDLHKRLTEAGALTGASLKQNCRPHPAFTLQLY